MFQNADQVLMSGNAAGEGGGAVAPTINHLIRTLREARQELRMTQLDLAARIGVTEITMVEWESRRDVPATGNLIRWAHELGYVVEIREASTESAKDSGPGPSPSIRSVETRIGRISRTLKQARVKRGLTQESLGAELGVSAWTVRMWESAQRTPRLIHLVEWCGSLNCRLALTKV